MSNPIDASTIDALKTQQTQLAESQKLVATWKGLQEGTALMLAEKEKVIGLHKENTKGVYNSCLEEINRLKADLAKAREALELSNIRMKEVAKYEGYLEPVVKRNDVVLAALNKGGEGN